MTRDDWAAMWGGTPPPEPDDTAGRSGCLVLFAVTAAVLLVIGVGIWWLLM